MSDPINLFLINTPLQLINVLEAKKELKISNSNSVIIFVTYSVNLITIKKIMDPSQWKEIYYVNEDIELLKRHEENFRKRKVFHVLKQVIFNFIKIKKIIKKFKYVDNLIVGYYSNLENLHIINSIKYNKLYLLDDGTATIEINNRRKNNVSFFDNLSGELYFKIAFKKYLLGYRIVHPFSVCFFTIYDIVVSPNDRIIRHHFKATKQLIHVLDKTNEVFFLGHPLSEVHPEILLESEYFNYLRAIIKYFEFSTLIYIPHKAECSEKLERIRKELGMAIKIIDLPIELFLLNQRKMPRVISGMATSALPNCKEIFGEEIEIVAFKINSEKIISKSMIAEIEDIYSYFDKISDNKFKLVSMD